jgi:hypothetical protein
MNRELSIDASQVTLGDDSTLTLTLSTESQGKPLLEEIGSQGIINLTFDHLADSRAPENHEFYYKVDGTYLHVEVESATTASRPPSKTANRGAFRAKPLYGELKLTTPQVLLAGRQSVTLSWNVFTWDRLGTFTVAGEVISGDPLELERELSEGGTSPTGLDFGPVKLRVQEQDVDAPVRVTLNEAARTETYDQTLWGLIRRRTISFSRYRGFIDRVLCTQMGQGSRQVRDYAQGRPLPFSRSASYSMLKYATEYFLMQEAGTALADEASLDGLSGNLNSQRPTNSVPSLDEQHRLGGPAFGVGALRDEYLEQLENEEGKVLPYFKTIREKLAEVPLKNPRDLVGGDDVCYGILKSKLQAPPLMELIWSYWHEEGGLVQTLNAISLRFQNVRRPGVGPDPLSGLNLDPLRPMSNLIWGYIEDERNRLTMNRRNLEYQYEYGFGLIGRGVQPIAVAEHRTFFLRGFHSLLRACTEFYQQANFTTVIPDGFPILNCLREVHMTLAEGAHNQYGDLPWTARAEMLTQQWLLARPEVREFLGGRVMVPYAEPWMDRVDTMKTLQGWNPTNSSHFHDLGIFGEQLLLSIRYGAWNSTSVGAANAANWAHYWREEIQRYIHAYKAVTGVDLATDLGDIRQNAPDNEERYLQPAQLIERQSAIQQGQLRRSRQLSGGSMGPLRQPAFGPVPRRRLMNE